MCADTITANFHWVKPDISGSPTTWGVKVNADLDLIDATVFGISKVADSQIGMVVMFAGATPPPNWKMCDGTVYDNSDIPLLAPILNNAFGGVVGLTNAVPDLRQVFPIGAGTVGSVALALGQTGGEATHTLVTAETPSHTHALTDPQHSHTINDPGHWHEVATNIYGASSGTDHLETFSGSGGTTSTEWAATGITATDNASTGITMGNTGGDGAHNNMPPYLGINFIIKFQ